MSSMVCTGPEHCFRSPCAGTELSQRDLVRLAFAGDDVQAEFAAAKAAEVGEELPLADVAAQLPGWGQWAGRSRQPAWLAAAKNNALKCAFAGSSSAC